MKILFLIITGYFLTINFSFAQKDSVPTISLQIYNSRFRENINKIVLPHKSIKVKTTEGIIFKAKKIQIAGDSAIAFSNDTVPFKNIKFIFAKTKGYAGQSIAGMIMIAVGSLVSIPVGLVYFMLPVETSHGSDSEAEIKRNASSGLSFLGLGAGLISSGIALQSRTRFKTQNKWNITACYYKK